MGKIGFTPLQYSIFNAFSKEPLSSQFYFTGGTALSTCYFHHRESEDLDFFTEKEFDNNRILEFMEKTSKKLKIPYRFTQRDRVRFVQLVKKDHMLLKIDFVHHPFRRVEKGTVMNGMTIDSLRDIGGNKLLTINQRTDVKDFVDLYFLLKHFTLWDLLYVVEAKYRMQLDLTLIASDFLKVTEFDFLPKMLVPFRLKELQTFFRNQAIEIGKRVTE